MGIDLVDLLIQEPSLLPPLDRLSAELGLQLRTHLVCRDQTPAETLRQAKVSTERGYVLLLDPDEYLFLPGHSSLASFLEANQYPQSCYLRWVVTPSDFSHNDRCLGFFGHIGKHLAAGRVIAGIATAHTFALRDLPAVNPFQFERHDGFVIHYWGRTFWDVLLKCLYYRGVHKSKQSSLEELRGCRNGSLLPGRLKMLAALSLHVRYVTTPDYLDNRIDVDLESELLAAHLSAQEIERLEIAYREYKQFLASADHPAVRSAIQGYPGCHSIQKLGEVLPEMPVE